MSTLVMVEKDGSACMAADTLTTFGSRKQSAQHVENAEKIFRVGESVVGLVGWSAHRAVIRSVLAGPLELPPVSSEAELFEFSRRLHRVLKDEYFLNPRDEVDDPYESTQMMLYVLNCNGMFGLLPLREVTRYRRFAAAGSGSSYALGAMHAAFEQRLGAEEIARRGVAAAIEFDQYSLGPVTALGVKTRSEGLDGEPRSVTVDAA